MNGEYLIYTSDGSTLSPEQDTAAYNVLISLPYPMNTNPLNAPAIQDLSPKDQALLKTDEAAVILARLKQINPNIEIMLVPKSLQQLYLGAAIEKIPLSTHHEKLIEFTSSLHDSKKEARLAELKKQAKLFKSDHEFRASVDDDGFWYDLGAYVRNDRDFMDGDPFFYECNSINSAPHMREMWSALNAAMLAEITEVEVDLKDKDLFEHFADEWTWKLATYAQKEDCKSSRCDSININLLRKILRLEIDVMFNPRLNHYVVYRGSRMGPDGDQILIDAEPKHTLSLSNGAVEGAINDNGACAWYYMFLREYSGYTGNTGYALLVDPNLHQNSIVVPPLTNVARVLGFGEYFHVRTDKTNRESIKTLLQDNVFILSDQREDKSWDYFINPSSLTAYMAQTYSNDVSPLWMQDLENPFSKQTVTVQQPGTSYSYSIAQIDSMIAYWTKLKEETKQAQLPKLTIANNITHVAPNITNVTALALDTKIGNKTLLFSNRTLPTSEPTQHYSHIILLFVCMAYLLARLCICGISTSRAAMSF